MRLWLFFLIFILFLHLLLPLLIILLCLFPLLLIFNVFVCFFIRDLLTSALNSDLSLHMFPVEQYSNIWHNINFIPFLTILVWEKYNPIFIAIFHLHSSGWRLMLFIHCWKHEAVSILILLICLLVKHTKKFHGLSWNFVEV